ncbi:hypothetical protein A9Q99_01540 [Gammaproteobacteria bacterium 45_16_T64]|nr:hypothetical protein A9Q99_01540 [Gammaproteobacteria bacterium 45_16_T64]
MADTLLKNKQMVVNTIPISRAISFILISVFVAFGVAVSLFLYTALENDFGKIQQQDFDRQINSYGALVAQHIESHIQFVRDISSHPYFTDALNDPKSNHENLQSYMDGIRPHEKGVDIILLQPGGTIVYTTGTQQNRLYQEQTWVDNLISNGDDNYFNVYQKNKKYYFTFATAIKQGAAKTGILLTETPVEALSRSPYWPTDENHEKIALYHKDQLILSIGLEPPLSTRSQYDIEKYNILIVGQLNNLTLLTTRDKILTRFMVTLFLLSLCAVLVIFKINKTLVIEPLWNLREITNQISNGKFRREKTFRREADIKAKRYQLQEINNLSNDIMSMAGTLNTREQSLQESNNTLEQRVLERTQELQITHDLALSANRAKSGFLATMSHEIRTPMNAVLGILGLLRKTNLTPRQNRLVQTGRDSGELLLTIINDILDFSKMEADRLQLEHTGFNLKHLLESTIRLLKSQADSKKITLELIIHPDTPTFVKGDPDRLRQVLINLINNAIKFTSCGSIKVVVSTTIAAEGEKFNLLCAVKDTGVGIPDEVKESLFDEFTMADQTHSRRYEGTGLGLAICKRLVSLMGGEISLSSEVGNGSTFTFTASLESAANLEEEISRKENEAKLMPAPGTRVLLAEDNPANQMLVKDILEEMELHVDTAGNGLEAVQAIRDRPYDVVLMDISMPEMDGMTATHEIRKLPRDVSKTPIIALTAHVLAGDRERFIEAGMDDYLTKPIDRAETLHCIAVWTGATELQPDEEDYSEAKTMESNDKKSNEPRIAFQQNDKKADVVDEPQNENTELVSEGTLLQLAKDTSPNILPKLLTLYMKDAKERMQRIQQAISDEDMSTLEFEVHTVGSSAGAHSNIALLKLARKVEQLCQEKNFEEAVDQASSLNALAKESFDLLERRVAKGFE